MAYDGLDRISSVTDANGLITAYEYDTFGDLKKVTSPDTGVSQFTYDSAGNTKTKTDARGVLLTYTYDKLNRLTFADLPGSAEDITLFYDSAVSNSGVGQLTSVTDESGTSEYTYDGRGLIVKDIKTVNGFSFTTQYQYDDASSLIQMTYPSSQVVDFDRDNVGRISKVSRTKSGQSKILASGVSYLPFGPITGMTHGNGLELTRTFDKSHNLTAQSTTGLSSLDYTYTARDNVSAITDLLDNVNNQNFTYDNVSRLETANGNFGEQKYSFDLIGNRIVKNVDDTVTQRYRYLPNTHRLGDTFDYGLIVDIAEASSSTNASNHYGDIGSQFYYRCPPGLSQATVYGTGIYTYDSSLCSAAVHQGLITFALGGEVVVEMLGGQPSYSGTTANGVTSYSYTSYGGSFTLQLPSQDLSNMPVNTAGGSWTANASQFQGQNEYEFSHVCSNGGPSGNLGTLWGTGI
ncbi:MAG: YD repeat-containing protein, partial [Arenicella sp.]